jgi:NADH dehydrogenase
MSHNHTHQVVIVGGGFAGLNAAQFLRRARVQVTLIDRRNFHLFQPLLYQVATGGLSPADIASPLRAVLSRQRNVRVVHGEVTGFDAGRREVQLGEDRIAYDTLIVATGARHHYFGNSDWEQFAPGLKSIEDAIAIRRRVFTAFERAEQETDDAVRRQMMTFVVVGGGPTGVELAGAIGELANHTLRNDFRSIDTTQATVLLLEGSERILPTYPIHLSEKATASLESLGVTVCANAFVTQIQPDHVMISVDGRDERIATRTVLWGAGVRASSLGMSLAEATGAQTDRQGRVIVQPDLSIPGHPEILVLGDLAHFQNQDGDPLPGVAPVAMQQGRYAARRIKRTLQGKTSPPFHYKDRGSMAVIGRSAAVAQIGKFQMHGFPAWLVWLFVHLINLVEFQNRVLVLAQWAWNYLTRNRSARLITEQPNPTRNREPFATKAARDDSSVFEERIRQCA